VGSIKPEYLVRAFPGFSAAQMSRHAFCQLPRAPGVLRVVTYNILLDGFPSCQQNQNKKKEKRKNQQTAAIML
jgi:hypothetical protein